MHWHWGVRFVLSVAAFCAAMAMSPGRRAFLQYVGDIMWHERIALSHVDQNEWIIATPDFDLYAEQLDSSNVNLDGFRLQTREGEIPLGIAAADVYGFRVLTPAEMAQLTQEGDLIAQQERQARGLGAAGGGLALPPGAAVVPVPAAVPIPAGAAPVAPAAPAAPGAGAAGGVVPVPPAAAAVRIAPAGGVWIVDEPVTDFDLGDELVLPPGAAQLGPEVALVVIGGEPTKVRLMQGGTNITEYVAARKHFLSDDLRVLPASSSEREFIGAVRDMAGPRSVGPPSPLEGPDSKTWWLDKLVRSGIGSMVARHHRWRHESGVQNGRLVHEHELISRAIEVFVTIDGINLKQCEGAEVLLRRLQLLEEAVVDSPSEPNFENAEHWLGFGERKGGALIAPALKTHVSAQIGKEAAILKERRKAREARAGKGAKKGE